MFSYVLVMCRELLDSPAMYCDVVASPSSSSSSSSSPCASVEALYSPRIEGSTKRFYFDINGILKKSLSFLSDVGVKSRG